MRTSAIAARLLASGIASIVLVALASPVAAAADITGPVQVTTQPAATTNLAVGDPLSLTAAAADSLDADVPVAAWQYADSPGGTFTDIPSSAGLGTFTIASTVLGDGGVYRAAFPDGAAGRVFSSNAVVNVGTPASVGSITGSSTAAPGGALELVAQDVAGTAPLTVVWQTSTSASGPWSAAANSSGVAGTLSTTVVSQPFTTVYYRAVVSNAFGSETTAAFTVTTTDWTPLQVTSVTVSNPSSGVLKATWPAASAGGGSVVYRVAVLDLSDQVIAAADTASTTYQVSVAAGSYRVRVITSTGSTDSSPTYSGIVAVKLLARTGTVSAGVVRPYVDGYQDSVRLKATSTFAGSGAIRVRNSGGKLVRSYVLATGTSWSVVFNGKTASGTRLADGTYKVQFVLGGSVYVTRSVVVATTQVGTPSASWSIGTVYPVKDGYGDTSKMTARTTIPATQKLVIRNSSGKTVYSASLTRRTLGSFTWSGRSSSGSMVPAGSYKATLTVKAGEGSARSVVRGISVSGKKLTPVSFSGTISAVNAYDGTIVGDYEPVGDGSIGLWSSYYLGDTIHAFSLDLPSSFGNRYSNLKVYGCGESSSYTGQAGLLRSDADLNSDYGGWLLGSDSACYGGSWDPSLLNGRRMYLIVGNVAADSTYYWLEGFKVTGTKYVLK